MPYNLKATVRYDGTDFAGWQIQPRQPTVQGAIEDALTLIAQCPVPIAGAGRTDAGAHALAQVFSFQWREEPPIERLIKSLSKMLAPAIRIEKIEPVPETFHARFSATGKKYAYSFSLAKRPDPFSERYAWCVPWELDLDRLQALTRKLIGRHDFAGFQCAGASVQSTVRVIHSIRLVPGGVIAPIDARDLWRLQFHGDGFLYKMVRNITGTVVDITRDNLPPERLDELLQSPGPFRGRTAPARGLTLLEVLYESLQA